MAEEKAKPAAKKTVRVFSQSLKFANLPHSEDFELVDGNFIGNVTFDKDGYADVTPKQAKSLKEQYRRQITIVG